MISHIALNEYVVSGISISALVINRFWWFYRFQQCFLCIIFEDRIFCVGFCSFQIHVFLHKQLGFILLRFIAWFFLFALWYFIADFKNHTVHWFWQNSERYQRYLTESIELHLALLCSVSMLCLYLNTKKIWFTLVSIAFNDKGLEEFSFCSISMFNTIGDVCDSINHDFISYSYLLVWIHLSCFQQCCSFYSILCACRLDVASKQDSIFWIGRNILFVSRIGV